MVMVSVMLVGETVTIVAAAAATAIGVVSARRVIVMIGIWLDEG